MALTLTLQTPFATLFKGDVDKVSLRTTAGQMEVLSGHAPLAGVIEFSTVKVQAGKHEDVYYARHGTVFMHTRKNKLHILVGHCEKVGEAQYETVEQYLSEVQALLAGTSPLTGYELTQLTSEEIAANKLLRMTKKRSQ